MPCQVILRTCTPLATCFKLSSRTKILSTTSCSVGFRHFLHPSVSHQRKLSTSCPKTYSQTLSTSTQEKPIYNGPLASTFRRLKIFSLSSLALSTTLAPFMFIVESSLPLTARFALAAMAVGTSGISTGLVAWCGMPYVNTLRRLTPKENTDAEGIEMTTLNLLLHPKITRVYDPIFLVETKRAFAKWELADSLILPGNKTTTPGNEETVAETMDKDGNVLGRWIVTWRENGEGTCREVGHVIRYFNVHEELLN